MDRIKNTYIIYSRKTFASWKVSNETPCKKMQLWVFLTDANKLLLFACWTRTLLLQFNVEATTTYTNGVGGVEVETKDTHERT